MPNLLTDAAAMDELDRHLDDFENDIPYFYVDSEGLITIAIGEMVDQRYVPLAARRVVAHDFAVTWHTSFTNGAGAHATPPQVLADWDAVAGHYPGPGAGAALYPDLLTCATLCHLRIRDPAARRRISRSKVTTFFNELTKKKPFMMRHNTKIQMAFIDTRYNPGTPMYSGGPHASDIRDMWNMLDPDHRSWDPEQAKETFRTTWEYIADHLHNVHQRPHYKRRVAWRVTKFEEGLAAMPKD